MICPNCGYQNTETTKYCTHCGKPVFVNSSSPNHPSTSGVEPTKTPKRATRILIFGILSLLFFGALLGIPAWIMGANDLKRIRAGLIDFKAHGSTQLGMVLGIIGTFISPGYLIVIAVVTAVSMFMMQGKAFVAKNRDAIVLDMANLAADCHQYRQRPVTMGGGGGTYAGYKISPDGNWGMRDTNATFEIVFEESTAVKIRAVSKILPPASVEVIYDGDGRLTDGPISKGFEY